MILGSLPIPKDTMHVVSEWGGGEGRRGHEPSKLYSARSYHKGFDIM